jgi:hypothetical protein
MAPNPGCLYIKSMSRWFGWFRLLLADFCLSEELATAKRDELPKH